MHPIEALPPETRQRILDGAARMFCQDGYEGASMSNIAAQAGVSKGTLYNYFVSKEALFAAYIEASCNMRMARLFEGVAETDHIRDGLYLLAQRGLTMMMTTESVELYRLIVSIAPKFPDLAEIFFQAGPNQALSKMQAFLERAHSRGQLHVPDPRFAAEQFFSLCQSRICLRRRLNLPEDPPEMIEQVIEGAVEMFLKNYEPKS